MTALSHFVHIAPAIEALETITLWGARVYDIGSEIFTITAILWCLNFLGNAIQKTFQFGYAFGKFYRRWMHSHLKSFVIRVIALVILLGQLPLRAHRLFTTTVVKSLSSLTLSVTPLVNSLPMPLD